MRRRRQRRLLCAFWSARCSFRLFVADSFMKYLLLWSMELQLALALGLAQAQGLRVWVCLWAGPGWAEPLQALGVQLRIGKAAAAVALGFGYQNRARARRELRCLPGSAKLKSGRGRNGPEKTNSSYARRIKARPEQCCVKGNCLSIT